MKKLLSQASQASIENIVADIEKKTSAEIVVAISRHSGDYRDVSYLSGCILTAVSLAVLVLSPFNFHMYDIIPVVLVSFFLGYWLCRTLPGLCRLLTTKGRRKEQVQKASHRVFFEEGVAATRQRHGILVYLSLFERLVEIVPDVGIDGAVPRAEWHTLRHRLNALMHSGAEVEAILQALSEGMHCLSQAFPPGEDNPDEIPNRPRIIQ